MAAKETTSNEFKLFYLIFVKVLSSGTSSETQGFKGDGKGREKLGAGKKERGGEGKGKRKGDSSLAVVASRLDARRFATVFGSLRSPKEGDLVQVYENANIEK